MINHLWARGPIHVRTAPAFVVGLVFFVAARLSAQETQAITQVSAIRALTAEQAGEGRMVNVRGVVTVVSGWKNSFFFADTSAGISVDPVGDIPPLHQGQQVEIQGVTGPGMFAPVISAERVKVLGNGYLPPGPLVDLDKLAGGRLDSQWITVKGNVRTASVKPSWGHQVLFLDVDVGAGTLVTVRIRDFPETGWQHLPMSIVSIRGVCATTFNDKRQFLGLRLFVASLNDVAVLQSDPPDPFDLPLRPLSALLRFDPKQENVAPARVRGTVTHLQPDQGIYIQDGSEGVLLRGTQTTSIAIGEEVEAVGYPGGGGYSPSLENSIFRVLDEKPKAVTPVTVRASEMIVDNQGFSTSPYDSGLVRLRGILEQAIPGVDERVLFLRDGALSFTARLPNTANSGTLPPVGSLVEVTGVCATRVDNGHEARAFRILLRTPSDITVIQRAPWWNTSHAQAVVMVLLIVVLLLAGWLILLRREGRLRHLALTDPLTGLYNRRGFLLLADHEWQLALRKRAALLMFFIDIDDFKAINDTFGHKEGDVALQVVATALRECFRKTDLIGRAGGDEFVVAAIEAAPSFGEHLKQRLAEIVEQMNRRDGRKFHLSLSVGMVVCDEASNDASLEELLAHADALMYEGKRSAKLRGHQPEILQSSFGPLFLP